MYSDPGELWDKERIATTPVLGCTVDLYLYFSLSHWWNELDVLGSRPVSLSLYFSSLINENDKIFRWRNSFQPLTTHIQISDILSSHADENGKMTAIK
jgi:hypothetical protein